MIATCFGFVGIAGGLAELPWLLWLGVGGFVLGLIYLIFAPNEKNSASSQGSEFGIGSDGGCGGGDSGGC